MFLNLKLTEAYFKQKTNVEIKQALGSSQKKRAPLKYATREIIQGRAQGMECWVRHYSELYAREDMVS